jgi:hypothetical protein
MGTGQHRGLSLLPRYPNQRNNLDATSPTWLVCPVFVPFTTFRQGINVGLRSELTFDAPRATSVGEPKQTCPSARRIGDTARRAQMTSRSKRNQRRAGSGINPVFHHQVGRPLRRATHMSDRKPTALKAPQTPPAGVSELRPFPCGQRWPTLPRRAAKNATQR